MQPSIKRYLCWAGTLLAISAVVFVGLRFHGYYEQIEFSRLMSVTWLILAGLSVVWGSANLLLALAWKDILQHLGSAVETGWAIRVYGTSQLAKYVPGNIFHFAGRQALGLAGGHQGWLLAKSAVWEIGLLAITGFLFGILILPLIFKNVTSVIAFIFFVCLICLVILVTVKWISPSMAKSFFSHTIYLCIQGFIFVAILEAISSQSFELSNLPVLCGTYVIAWLAGFVTPGAPAGIGIREFVLLFLMGNAVLDAELLLAVLLVRMVTIGGDLLFFQGRCFGVYENPEKRNVKHPDLVLREF